MRSRTNAPGRLLVGGVLLVAAGCPARNAATAPGADAGPPAAARPAPTPRQRTVAIRGMKFDPPEIEARAGDTITWTNADIVPHTVTATDKAFDSGPLQQNASFRWVVRGSGRIAYGCSFHPTMTGAVLVGTSNRSEPGAGSSR